MGSCMGLDVHQRSLGFVLRSRESGLNWRGIVWLLAFALLLSGCSGQPDTPPVQESEGGAQADGATQQLVEEGKVAARERLEAMFPGIGIPDVDLVRIISLPEFGEVMAQCMTEAGFNAQARADGGVSFEEIPQEQSEAQSLALYVCQAKYPVDPVYTQPLTDAQIDFLYDYYRDDFSACLQAEGFSVGELPSRSKFKEAYAGVGEPYTPYAVLLENVDPAHVEKLMSICPEVPQELWQQ